MRESILHRIVGHWNRGVKFLNESPRVRLALILLLVLTPGLSGFKIATQSRTHSVFLQSSRSDFDDYFQAAKTLSGGGDPYHTDQLEKGPEEELKGRSLLDPENLKKLARMAQSLSGVGSYLYPPFTAYVLMPLSHLSYEWAAYVFQTLSLLALGLFLYHLYRWSVAKGHARRIFDWSALLSLLMLSRFMTENAENGNLGYFLILFSGSGLLLAFRPERRWEMAGGFLLGVATVMKISPGFLGLVLIAGFRPRAILAMGAGALFALLVPALTFGYEGNLHLLDNWRTLLLDRYGELGFVRPWVNNQSLSGAMGKLFVPGSDMKQARFGLPLIFSSRLPTKAEFSFLVNLLWAINLILVGSALVTSLVLAWRSRSNPLRPEHVNFSRILFVAMLVALLVSGVSWHHAFSVLLVPLFLRLHSHLTGDSPLRRSETVMFVILAFFGFLSARFSPAVRDWLAIYSLFTAVSLAITGVMIFHAIREGTQTDGI